MKYNLNSVTKFGDSIKDMLSQKSYEMINKYKEYSTSTVFNKKVHKDVSTKETN